MFYENDKRGEKFMYDGFIVSGCVLAGLIGVFFLWTGYRHLQWTYYQHIFMKNFEKYGGKEQ